MDWSGRVALWSVSVITGDSIRDLRTLVVPSAGSLLATGDPFEQFRLVDNDGAAVRPVTVFLRELSARGMSVSTQRSYGMDLLRWFRFLRAVGVVWDQATRVEARDFCCWLQIADKPLRPHWRRTGLSASA